MKKALILMTRVPIPGQTKTRLMSIYTKEECAQIHRCFLKDIFNIYEYIKEDIDIYLTYTPKEKFYLIEDSVPKYIKTFPQSGDTLGDKMKSAINKVLDRGYDEVILTGCDIPHIQVEDIRDAFKILDSKDMVLGPTTDGGYYLIGMKKIINEVFDTDLNWGYKTVLEGTIDICNKNNVNLDLCNKLTDIDTSEDIDILYNQITNNQFDIIPQNTFEFILNHKEDEKYA